MSMVNAEMYDALIAADTPDDKARATASAIFEETVATRADIARVERGLLSIKWMIGLVISTTIIPLIKNLVTIQLPRF